MEFSEEQVKRLSTSKPDELLDLLARLCGQDISLKCAGEGHQPGSRCGGCSACIKFEMLRQLCDENRWNRATLNQALLVCSQPTMSEGFYGEFFGSAETGDNLKGGVVKFRGMAILRFGNFRFAYKRLCSQAAAEVRQDLEPYSIPSEDWDSYYTSRPRSLRSVRPIPQDKKWYLGYISGTLVDQDLITLVALGLMLGKVGEADALKVLGSPERVKKATERKSELQGVNAKEYEDRFEELEAKVVGFKGEIEQTQALGRLNTAAYLSSEHLDVYAATSMRESWEYEETSKFLERVFANEQVKGQSVVHFDPTLSFCKNRIDKGLIEGLMLKRARCTLYMVQETDTLGKDSELASTLAQGKPVIAYVPKETVEQVKARLEDVDSLHLITKRVLLMLAELRDLPGADRQVLTNFLAKAATFSPVFRLDSAQDQAFLSANQTDWAQVKEILARAESTYFEKRANILKAQHPLALQVHLETGVANGVLVVRSAEDCAQLLSQLLTNRCAFSIERVDGVHILREKISQCPFRVMTDDQMLTNSFWDFYARTGDFEGAPRA